jgi:hypothetical protein
MLEKVETEFTRKKPSQNAGLGVAYNNIIIQPSQQPFSTSHSVDCPKTRTLSAAKPKRQSITAAS